MALVGEELQALVREHLASLPSVALVLDDGADRGAAVRPALALDREMAAHRAAESARMVAWAVVGVLACAGVVWAAVR